MRSNIDKKIVNLQIFSKNNMQITQLVDLYSLHPNMDAVRKWQKQSKSHLLVRSLTGSARAIFLSTFFSNEPNYILYLAEDEEKAAYIHHDLEVLLNNDKAMLFPSAYRKHKRTRTADSANEIQRTETLNVLANSNEPVIVVTSPEAIMESVTAIKNLKEKTLTLAHGLSISQDTIVEQLFEWGFERVDFVYEPGQVSVRGGIIDIFSYAHEMPYRIDMFGDEIDSIREFDIHTQLSQSKLESVKIIPNLQDEESGKQSLLNYLPDDTTIVSDDFAFVLKQIEQNKELYGDDYFESDYFITTACLVQGLNKPLNHKSNNKYYHCNNKDYNELMKVILNVTNYVGSPNISSFYIINEQNQTDKASVYTIIFFRLFPFYILSIPFIIYIILLICKGRNIELKKNVNIITEKKLLNEELQKKLMKLQMKKRK